MYVVDMEEVGNQVRLTGYFLKEEANVVSSSGVNSMGIIEDIVARLAAIEAKLAQPAVAQPAVAQPAATPAYVPPVAAQPQFDPMTGQPIAAAQPAAQQAATITGYDPNTGQPIYGTVQPAVQPVAGAVTEAQVMALIEPHLENVPVKTALQGVLAQMGIARLPDARPDQYAALYQAFSHVIQQFAGAAVQPAAVPQGII